MPTFDVVEWRRLDAIATAHEPKYRAASTRAMVVGDLNVEAMRREISMLMIDVCRSTADAYGLAYRPTSGVYLDTIDRLVAAYEDVLDAKKTRLAVSAILPSDLSVGDREKRLRLADGLESRSAVRIEQMRQSPDPAIASKADQERQNALQARGNLLAVTEVNRGVNASLVAFWRDNEDVSKAEEDVTFFDSSIKDIGAIPRRARKEIVTRRDDRVCNYCFPLDGVKARLTEDFDTEYGFFPHPPFHPRCRCFMIVSA